MINLLFESPLLFVITVIGLIFAITIHEFAHAFAADHLGDPTPRLQGRVTLNPIKHLDLYGSLFILFIGFGWGKPVQYDPFNLENPQKDSAIISFAGPLSNILMAGLVGLITFLTGPLPGFIESVAYLFIFMNLGLAIFNLIPVAPLDGFRIVGGLLPEEKAREWNSLERYGMIFLLLLILPLNGSTTMISFIVQPVVSFLANIFAGHLM